MILYGLNTMDTVFWGRFYIHICTSINNTRQYIKIYDQLLRYHVYANINIRTYRHSYLLTNKVFMKCNVHTYNVSEQPFL